MKYKIIYLIIFIITFVLIIIGFNREYVIYDCGSLEIDVFDNGNLDDYNDYNSNIVIDTSIIHEENVFFKYKDSYGKLLVKVIDREEPYIGLSSYVHVIGEEFDMQSNVLVADNYSVKVSCNIIGDYDINKEGIYNLKYECSDEALNKNVKDFNLYVVKEFTASKTSKNYLYYDDLLKYGDKDTLVIDVSKWNSDIDWKKVSENFKYALIRIGTQKDFGLDSKLDNYFEKNIKEATRNGVKVGVYYYSYAKNTKEAYDQAMFVLDNIKDYKLDLPIVFDWECFKYYNLLDINIHDLNMIADKFLSTIKEHGYDVMLYSSKVYLENFWKYIDYDVWLAHYTNKTNYEGKYVMWQFTNLAILDGINGEVDVSVCYNCK